MLNTHTPKVKRGPTTVRDVLRHPFQLCPFIRLGVGRRIERHTHVAFDFNQMRASRSVP
jgi:hypothetical protein